MQALLPAQRCGEKVTIHNGAMLSSPHNLKNFHKTVPHCHDTSDHTDFALGASFSLDMAMPLASALRPASC
jgi:hypothetical protein